ncbi:hypothetical protein FACS1894147_00820 [Spirochaetia bacterium]|nr:hypothetical protein FACS1894147_00820 [Spirochaetia bacterium]
MIQLRDVYGIQNDLPEYTYVVRESCDKKLEYLLGTQRHIVIHGASKQGKSCLRKKIIGSKNIIIIQCQPEKTIANILKEICNKLQITFPTTLETTSNTSGNASFEVQGKARLPFIAEGSLTTGVEAGIGSETKQLFECSGIGENDLEIISRVISKKNMRIIFEDFHYLSEEQRKNFSFLLKSFYEYSVYIIIIGIWAEHNLLTYYNGDLTGRIEEIDMTWTNEELYDVIKKGENPLRIIWQKYISENIIEISYNNVGITQRLCEKICLECGYLNNRTLFRRSISDVSLIKIAKKHIINDISQRYNKIYEVFMAGFEDTDLKVYLNVFKALTTISRNELKSGIPQNHLLTEINSKYNPGIRLSDLTSALKRIERLQATRQITPFLITYNENTREIYLVDREFIFYIEQGNPSWEWLQE